MSDEVQFNNSETITAKVERLEEIAETLEAGNIDLATAKELREEADGYLEKLRDELDTGDGEIIEVVANNEGIGE